MRSCAIDDVAIGRAAAVGDPGPRTRAHDGFERRHEAAGRSSHLDGVAHAHVDIRLAVGHDDHFLSPKFVVEDGSQGIRRPGEALFVPRLALRFEVANQFAQVAGNRAEFRRVRPVRRAQKPFAPEQRAHALHPAAPAQLRDDDGEQRHDHAETEEQVEDVASRLFAPVGHETHVVHEDQAPAGCVLGPELTDGHEERPMRAGQDVPGRSRERREVRAPHGGRQRARRDRRRLGRRAERGGVDAFVLGHPREDLTDPFLVSGTGQVLHRVLDGVGDQAGSDVEIPHEPPHRQVVHDRKHRVRECREDDQERNDESEGKTHGTLIVGRGDPRSDP